MKKKSRPAAVIRQGAGKERVGSGKGPHFWDPVPQVPLKEVLKDKARAQAQAKGHGKRDDERI